MGIDEDLIPWTYKQSQFKRNFKVGDLISVVSRSRRYASRVNHVAKVLKVYDNPPRVYFKTETGKIDFIVPASIFSDGYKRLMEEKKERQIKHKENVQNAANARAGGGGSSSGGGGGRYERYSYQEEPELTGSLVDSIYSRNRIILSKRKLATTESSDYSKPAEPRVYKEIFDRNEKFEVRIITEDEYEQLSQLRADSKLLNQLKRQEISDRELKKEQAKKGFVINDSFIKTQLASYLNCKDIIKNTNYEPPTNSSDFDQDDTDDSYETVYVFRDGHQEFDSDDSDVYSISLNSGGTPDFYYQGFAVNYEGALNDDGLDCNDIEYDEEEYSYTLTAKEIEDWEKLKTQHGFESNEQLRDEYTKLYGLFESNYIPKYEFIIRRNTLCAQYSNNSIYHVTV